jgi:hypothetical protein
VTPHHREMLKLHLQLIGALQNALESLDAAAGKLLAPMEIGVDMSRASLLPGPPPTRRTATSKRNS